MKIAVIGHGMVGHKFLEQLHELGLSQAQVTVLCEEPRPAYDRVHLSEFFAGKTAEDLSLVEPGFFERTGFSLKLAARAVAIERRNNTSPRPTARWCPTTSWCWPPARRPSCRRCRAATARTASSTAPSKTSRP